MISAWKKFINRSSGESSGQDGLNMPPGVQRLDKELQRKFARGINYNMKVVIKGDSRVGKTSLFLRLKGYGFDDNYIPTDSLNVTSIDWSYKATDDIIKIDIWEAIDNASKKTVNFVDLKLENNPNDQGSVGAIPSNSNNTYSSTPGTQTSKLTISSTKLTPGTNDDLSPIPQTARQSLVELCENLDVYKGAHAVLLVMDMTKSWTFKYIQSELPKVPKHIPVLLIANHRDQGHYRTVSAEQVNAYIDGLDRDSEDGIVMYTEASMKNGFGLKLIERFLNIPYLKLQKQSLQKQLELNKQESTTTLEELSLMQAAVNDEYERYLELQTVMRRQQADALSPVNSGLKSLDENKREHIRNSTVSSDSIDKNCNVKSIESSNNQTKPTDPQVIANQSFVNDRLPSIVIGAKCPFPDSKTLRSHTHPGEAENQAKPDMTKSASDSSEDEEEPKANPLVANYQSDLDSDDQIESSIN